MEYFIRGFGENCLLLYLGSTPLSKPRIHINIITRFPSISNYDYSNNYGREGKDGKRKKVKKKENKKKRMPIGVTIRYIPPPLTINQMVSCGNFCIVTTLLRAVFGK